MISYETDVVSKLNEEQFGEVIRLIHLTSPKQLVCIYEQAKIRKIFLTHAFMFAPNDWSEVEDNALDIDA